MRVLLLCGVLLIAACTSEDQLPTVHGSEPLDVSLLQLIANPMEYHGKVVRLIGFCRLEFEGNALYLHREDFERSISKNAIWLSVGWPVSEPRRRLSDEYVLVEGTFDGRAQGHLGSFSGELREIARMERWPSRVEFERQRRPPPRP